jgi:hypothetical protein
MCPRLTDHYIFSWRRVREKILMLALKVGEVAADSPWVCYFNNIDHYKVFNKIQKANVNGKAFLYDSWAPMLKYSAPTI